MVLCGDLNVAHRPIDLKNPKTNRGNAGYSDEERGKFSELLACGFLDSFRTLYPEKTEGTEGAAQTAGKTAAAGKPEAAPARSGQTEKPRYPRPDAQQAYEGLL